MEEKKRALVEKMFSIQFGLFLQRRELLKIQMKMSILTLGPYKLTKVKKNNISLAIKQVYSLMVRIYNKTLSMSAFGIKMT